MPIHFEENDDIIMSLIASGGYSGIPDPHLVFINYLYGLLLVALYNISSSIEWYTLMFCVLHIIALSVIIYFLIKTKINKITKILFVILFYIFEIRLIMLIQFTTTATIVAFSGFLLVLLAKKPYKLLGACLLILGSLIRFEASALVLVLSIPIVFLFPKLKNRNIIKL